MKKWLIRIALAALVLIIIAAVTISIYLDTIAHNAVEYGSTYALGVDTTIDDLNLKPIAGKLTLDRFNIPNPPGFDTPQFLLLNHANVELNIRSLNSDHVLIPNLTLSGIHINLERKNKSANYDVILNNLKKFESVTSDQSAEPEPDTPDTPAQQFTIQTLLLKDIHVQADLTDLGKLTRVPIDIDQILLTDVGSGSDNAALAAKLTDVITKALLAGIAKKVGSQLPGDIANQLGHGLAQLSQVAGIATQLAQQTTQEIGKHVDQAGKMMGKAVEGTAEGVGKVAEDTAKEVGKTLEGAAKGLDKLFAPKQKEQQDPPPSEE